MLLNCLGSSTPRVAGQTEICSPCLLAEWVSHYPHALPGLGKPHQPSLYKTFIKIQREGRAVLWEISPGTFLLATYKDRWWWKGPNSLDVWFSRSLYDGLRGPGASSQDKRQGPYSNETSDTCSCRPAEIVVWSGIGMAWHGLHGCVGGSSSQCVGRVTREKEIHAQDTQGQVSGTNRGRIGGACRGNKNIHTHHKRTTKKKKGQIKKERPQDKVE